VTGTDVAEPEPARPRRLVVALAGVRTASDATREPESSVRISGGAEHVPQITARLRPTSTASSVSTSAAAVFVERLMAALLLLSENLRDWGSRCDPGKQPGRWIGRYAGGVTVIAGRRRGR
jgi:hypothetical protein